MLESQIILEHPEELEKMLRLRSVEIPDIAKLQKLIEKRKKIIGEIQKLQGERNTLSKNIGALFSQENKTQKNKTQVQAQAEKHKTEVKNISAKILSLEKEKEKTGETLDALLAALPNWLAPDLPPGGENDYELIREHGARPNFSFPAKTHYDLGEKRGLLDIKRGVKAAGSRFYTCWGKLARLERILLNFMLDLHTKEFGYTEVYVPLLVNDKAMFITGQFPKFRGEYYSLESDGLSLIPTAEVPLINLYRDEILDEETLPIALVSASSCFRREAGAAGKDTRGLVRVHQFQKVELVQFSHPEESERIHQEMLKHAEEVLIRLELPYRVILKAAGDTGATAVKSYDLEVWMPGLKRWLEVSSVSNCRDYQARRGGIRFKGKGKGAKTDFVHTLNGSGIAAGRCVSAVMENYQQEDMDFALPKVLEKYL